MRSARMTERLTITLQDSALQGGASVSQRIGRAWGIQRSCTTSLRVMQRMTPTQPPHSLKRVGVDDFAFRWGTHYGTLVIDLDASKPVDVLPDWTATTLASWLRDHPEIEVVARDRSTEYARGSAEVRHRLSRSWIAGIW
ncbi:hypothetical protein EHF33_14100 [Deinococcus psychrotolerans]|uniref:Transposase IS204/IS1001/IS1096/IS1165 DDE domain-containing protein n=1 Tax=Deinococcus psychrotolerans TaxID=2489213 RepID=A0A3G8YFI1_9DEIO|nr:hypothetical protein EHF33_14100 [Deinococcus psychrotolerans]